MSTNVLNAEDFPALGARSTGARSAVPILSRGGAAAATASSTSHALRDHVDMAESAAHMVDGDDDDDDARLARDLQAAYDAEAADARALGGAVPIALVYPSAAELVARERSLVGGAPLEGATAAVRSGGLVFGRELLGLFNALYESEFHHFVRPRDGFQAGDPLAAVALAHFGFTLLVGHEVTRAYSFSESVLTEAQLQAEMDALVAEQKTEREYDRLDAAEARYMNGTRRDRNPILQAPVASGSSAHRASDGADERADDDGESYDDEYNDEYESGAGYLGGTPAPAPKPVQERLAADREASKTTVFFTTRANTNRHDERVVRFKKPPQSLDEFLARVNARWNLKGRARFRRAFDADGRELQAGDAPEPGLIVCSAGEVFNG